jgi:hypothetical protein
MFLHSERRAGRSSASPLPVGPVTSVACSRQHARTLVLVRHRGAEAIARPRCLQPCPTHRARTRLSVWAAALSRDSSRAYSRLILRLLALIWRGATHGWARSPYFSLTQPIAERELSAIRDVLASRVASLRRPRRAWLGHVKPDTSCYGGAVRHSPDRTGNSLARLSGRLAGSLRPPRGHGASGCDYRVEVGCAGSRPHPSPLLGPVAGLVPGPGRGWAR